jgi:hypothetical protein
VDSAITVAVVGGGIVLVGGWLARRSDAKTRREEKKADWARQDEVALRAENAAELVTQTAKLLRERQDASDVADAETARLLLEQNELVAQTSRETHEKLEVIRVDVNSNMTAAMQAELDATVRELALMNVVLGLRKTAGDEPDQEALVAIKATEERIAELRAKLNDRLSSADAAAAAAAAAATGGE